MEAIFEAPVRRLRRVFLLFSAVVALPIVCVFVIVLLFSDGLSSIAPLAFVLALALLASFGAAPLLLHLENKRLVLADGLLVQYRGKTRLLEARLEEIREIRAYTKRGFSNPLGLQRLAITLPSGRRIEQCCDDAAAVARAIVDAAGRPDLTIQLNPSPSKAYHATGCTAGAAIAGFVGWAWLSGHQEFQFFFMALWFLWLGITAVFLKKVSSRYGYRRVEVVLGSVALAFAFFSLYEFARFELSSDIEKGMWYVSHCQRKGAARAFHKALEAGREGPRLSYGLGMLAFLEKDYDQAAKRLEEALRKDPGLNDARYQLSRTYACMGRDEEAKRLLEEYLARGGGSWTSQARHALKEYLGH